MLKRVLNFPKRNISKSVLCMAQHDTLHASNAHASSSQVNDTHHHSEEEQVQYTPSDFNTPFWRNTFIFTIGFTILYHLNKNYERALKEKGQVHPITAYMSYYMADQQESHDKVRDILIQDQVHAAKRLLLFEAKSKEVTRPALPFSFAQKASPFCIPPGYDVDISKVKY